MPKRKRWRICFCRKDSLNSNIQGEKEDEKGINIRSSIQEEIESWFSDEESKEKEEEEKDNKKREERKEEERKRKIEEKMPLLAHDKKKGADRKSYGCTMQ